MKFSSIAIRRSLAALVLGASGAVMSAAPAVHANSIQPPRNGGGQVFPPPAPTIRVTPNRYQHFTIEGEGFTPGGWVQYVYAKTVFEDEPDLGLGNVRVSISLIKNPPCTAWHHCTIFVGGRIYVPLFCHYSGQAYRASALDATTGLRSNIVDFTCPTD